MASSAPSSASQARREQIVDTAWTILNAEGRDALTMRRLASELGIKAPSLYKHFPDKAAVEAAMIDRGFLIWGERARIAPANREPPDECRGRLPISATGGGPRLSPLTAGELDRARLTQGSVVKARRLVSCSPTQTQPRAFWAFMRHGHRDRSPIPPTADLERLVCRSGRVRQLPER
ncbi:MAG: TetR/AcrR family transcriptional regulator [Thermomicrobiales bacterium]